MIKRLVISVAVYVLKNILKIHPYTPFITEEVWSYFNESDFIINSQWPNADNEKINNDIDNNINFIMLVITGRNLKSELNISIKEIQLVCERQ